MSSSEHIHRALEPLFILCQAMLSHFFLMIATRLTSHQRSVPWENTASGRQVMRGAPRAEGQGASPHTPETVAISALGLTAPRDQHAGMLRDR